MTEETEGVDGHMKIAFFELEGWEKRYLKKALKGHTLKFNNKPLTLENIQNLKEFDAISVFIYSKIDNNILKKLPKLKLITTRSTGFDHIDLEECKKRNIVVCNVPFYGENTVAEHTFALILSLSRNIHKSYLRTQKHDYTIEGLKGFDLKDKTLGVVGAGRIGLHVIRIAKGFGMKVLVFDLNRDDFLAGVLGFKYAPLEELFKKSDIVTLHVPHNKHTHHLINRDTIKKMKKGAVLINTSRGGVVDTDALMEALDKKILAGAGLDVLEGEELIKEEKQILYDKDTTRAMEELLRDHTLLSKDNVVFTPHLSFYSQEALERILETTVQSILAYQSGLPQNTVTK